MDALAVQGVTMRASIVRNVRQLMHQGPPSAHPARCLKGNAGVEGLDREKPCELNPGGILVYLHNMIWERFPIVKAAPTFKRKGRRSLAPRREKSITSAGTASDPIMTSVEGSSGTILTARWFPGLSRTALLIASPPAEMSIVSHGTSCPLQVMSRPGVPGQSAEIGDTLVQAPAALAIGSAEYSLWR
jgi:hypothetical protein